MNDTLLDMVNDISIKLRGRVAGTNARPTKLEIIQAINDAQDAICGEKFEYSFLRKSATINAWLPAVGTSYYVPSLGKEPFLNNGGYNDPVSPSIYSIPATPNGGTYFMAEGYSQALSTCAIVDGISFTFYNFPSGGTMNGTFTGYIMGSAKPDISNPQSDPDIPSGVPDMNNIIATSTPIVVTNSVCNDINNTNLIYTGYPTTLTLQFDDTVALGNEGLVYLVIAYTPGPTNGMSLIYTQYPTRTGLSYIWNNSQIPTNVFPLPVSPATGNSFVMKLLTKNAVYASKPIGIQTVGQMTDFVGTNLVNLPIDLPLDCRRVNRIYNAAFACYLRPYPYDAYQYRPMVVPGDVFVISGTNPVTGCLKTILFPGLPYILQYTVDYMAVPTPLVNDGDISVIPAEFRAILKWKAIMQLYALNNAIPGDPAMFQADYMRLLSKINENYLPYEDISASVNVGGITDNNAPTRDYLNNQNVLNEFPNTWYEAKGGQGRDGGGF